MRKANSGPLDEKFENLVKETLDLWHIPGVAVGVVDGDKTWAKGYGIAAFPSTPVTPSTLFYTGSTTKAFTVAVMSILVDDNENYPQVQWDTPISQLIRDDFVLSNEYSTQHITIEDALSHRTGLPSHDKSYGRVSIRDITRSLRDLPLTAGPRVKYQYCNLMYIVASHIIETVTSKPLGDLLTDLVWKPLGMTTTFSSLEHAKTAMEEKLARGYYFADGGYHQVEWMPLDTTAGAGCTISNVQDYIKWIQALLKQAKPLSPSAYKEIWRPRMLIPSDPESPFTGPRAYTLGWRTGVYRGLQFFEHTGGMNAFGAQLIIFPDIDYGVIALANTAGTSNYAEQTLVFHLIDEKLGIPLEKRFNWDKKNLTTIETERTKVKNAVQLFYPSLPSPILATTMPLVEYAGTYWHPAYQNITIYLDESGSLLRADRTESYWPEWLTFEHVSGDYFVVKSRHYEDFGALYPDVYPAEFKVDVAGKVCKLAIGWEKGMGEEKIWLTRERI